MRTAGTPSRLDQVGRRHPDWTPWLALVDVALAAIGDETWARLVPPEPPVTGGAAPLLSGAALAVDAGDVRRHAQRLLARANGVAATGAGTPLTEADALALLAAAVNQDGAALDHLAARLGRDAALLRAVAPLVAMPLLHACRAAWAARAPAHWGRPWCPLCGAWPVVAEIRGLDRTRRHRCLLCGSDWAGEWLACPYCGNREHTRLGALVGADSPETRRAETCTRCLGYLKAVTTLQGCPPPELPLLDLETVELDVAAVAHGYRRPDGPGHRIDLRAEPARRRRGLLAWRR
jgi:FdhE protein